MIVSALFGAHQVMKLHPEELAARGSGQIASLLSIDINNLSWAMPTVHELWCIPLQLTICIYVLYQQIQWASLTGLGVMLVMTPPNTVLMKTLFRNQRSIMSTRDSRIKLLTEIMGSIRAVKLMSWEGKPSSAYHLSAPSVCTRAQDRLYTGTGPNRTRQEFW